MEHRLPPPDCICQDCGEPALYELQIDGPGGGQWARTCAAHLQPVARAMTGYALAYGGSVSP